MDTITLKDQIYPQLLREIHNPPSTLYYRGNVTRLHDIQCLAVVGTRKPTLYGMRITHQFITTLLPYGVTIISGLAYGIDAIAHRTTIACNGKTIAVLAGGLDDRTIYPSAHVQLAHEIITNGGLLLSEHPPGTPALRHHFLLRNRIISGLSRGVLVPECAKKSGAHNTVRHAIEQNRSVYAIPGSIHSPMSEGPHILLQQGAQLITKPHEILSDFNIPHIDH